MADANLRFEDFARLLADSVTTEVEAAESVYTYTFTPDPADVALEALPWDSDWHHEPCGHVLRVPADTAPWLAGVGHCSVCGEPVARIRVVAEGWEMTAEVSHHAAPED